MVRIHNRVIITVVAGALMGYAVSGPSAQTPAPATETFSMALTGNSLITRPLAIYKEPPFLKLIEQIRSADVAMTVVESGFNDYESYTMPAISFGTYMRADPALAKDLAWAGFRLAALATNHADNFGVVGARLTRKYVKEAGLVGAGTGENLQEAREAKFLETPKARVAFISVASTFAPYSYAGKTRGDIPGRPGLNPLRYTTTHIVTAERMAQLRTISTELGFGGGGRGGAADRFSFLGENFVIGDKPDVHTDPDPRDLEEIKAVVSNASRLADYTIVTIHGHEADRDPGMSAQFLVKFAHAMIDAGADVYSGQGPTNIRGVEIYKGKPILYALGDFIWGVDFPTRKPLDSLEDRGLGPNAGVADWNEAGGRGGPGSGPARDAEVWQGLVAFPRFRGKELVELTLQPISLGFGKPKNEYGRPMIADAQLSQKIGNDLIQRSKPFGTVITMKDGVAHVDLSKATAASR